MKHVVSYSGGGGSWYVAYRLSKEICTDDLILLFTDTLSEDKDLYRFLIETVVNIYGIRDEKLSDELVERCQNIPELYEDLEGRKKAITDIRDSIVKVYPEFVWIIEGRTLWETYRDSRYMGNGYISICSARLKQDPAKKYVKETFKPDEIIMYLGIDWTEAHRTKGASKGWSPYETKFPLVEDETFNKVDIFKELERLGIRTPQLYIEDFPHNNCGGFCVRMGQGGFASFLEKRPLLYEYHEKQEKALREYLDKDISILSKQKNRVKFNYTMEMLRADWESNRKNIDVLDIGGCGCFVTDDDESEGDSV